MDQTESTDELDTTLPLTFTHGGFLFTQEWRNDLFAVYSKTKRNMSGRKIWEFWRIKTRKPCVSFGKQYPAREVPPSDEDFGTWGWACRDIVDAQQRVKAATGTAIKLRP